MVMKNPNYFYEFYKLPHLSRSKVIRPVYLHFYSNGWNASLYFFDANWYYCGELYFYFWRLLCCIIMLNANFPNKLYSTSTCSPITTFWAFFWYFAGWWIIIETNASCPDLFAERTCYYLPGIFGSVGIFMVNVLPPRHYSRKYSWTLMVQLYCLLGFLIAFGALYWAAYILVNDFLLNTLMLQWPGYSIFTQNLFIFAANMCLKFNDIAGQSECKSANVMM